MKTKQKMYLIYNAAEDSIITSTLQMKNPVLFTFEICFKIIPINYWFQLVMLRQLSATSFNRGLQKSQKSVECMMVLKPKS